MSNHYHLVCISHDGDEQYSDEVGNHNAKPASQAVKFRENIKKIKELLQPLDITFSDVAQSHWDSYFVQALIFVGNHPDCDLILKDEYGASIPFDDEPDPHEGEDKFCSKCGGRLVGYGSGSERRCINNRH